MKLLMSAIASFFKMLSNESGAYYSDPITTPDVATDGLLKRTVADRIRRLYPGNPIMMMISPGTFPSDDDVVKKKGMISKRRVDNRKFERFTYSPPAVEFTAATFTSVASFTLTSSDGLRPTYCLLNTRNKTVCRIGNVSGTTISATTIGSTAFTVVQNDVLLKLAPAYPQNSSSPYLLMKDEDNHFGYTQISRFPVGISGSNREEDRFGPDYFFRLKENNVIDGFRTVETSFIFGQGPASGSTTSDAILGDSFQSSTGVWNWSTASYDASGNMTGEKYRGPMILNMNESARGTRTPLAQLNGQEFYGIMNEWIMDKMIINDSGKKEDFGVESEKFRTSGPKINAMIHDIFTRGSLTTAGLIFNPEMIQYVFLKNRDFQPNNDIQGNDVDGYTDEIIGEWGTDTKDGGESIMTLTSLF